MANPITRALFPLRHLSDGASVAPSPDLQGLWKADQSKIQNIEIVRILDNPYQARRHFDEEALAGLAASIEHSGLQQPILLRMAEKEGYYILVAGERRLRAHRLLGRPKILAIITECDDSEVISLVENVQRQDLNIVELADGIKALIEKRQYTQREAAAIVGISENILGRTLAVFKIFSLLPELLAEYQGSPAIVSNSMMLELAFVESPETLRSLWERAKAGRLSRNEVRNAVKREKLEKERLLKPKKEPPPSVLERKIGKQVEKSLKVLGTEVESLEVVRERLNEDQRQGLRMLRTKIDLMLV